MGGNHRLTRRAALGLIATGTVATASGAAGVSVTSVKRSGAIAVADDSVAILGLSAYGTATSPAEFTNGTDAPMDVTLDAAVGGIEFDVGSTGTYVSDPVTFSLSVGATESVRVRRTTGSGDVPVDVTASFGSSQVALRRSFATVRPNVEITDLEFDPTGNDSAKLNQEYVEFTNSGSVTVDLTGWTVEDEGANFTYTFGSFDLAPGNSVTLRTGSGTDDPDSNPDADLYWGRGQPVWNNDGDVASLFDASGSLRAQASGTGDVSSGGFTLDVNACQFDAPGSEYSNLDEEYVVFENTGTDPIDLGGWRVQDEGANHTYVFPTFTLQPGNSVTLRTGSGTDDSDSDPDADLYWGEDQPVWNNGGDTVTVYDGPPNNPNTDVRIDYSY
jgi:hypothetical protein